MTIFSRIINGEIPCYKIAEDENYFAFLDINPLNWGHTLVVPKREEDYLFDLADDELSGMIVFAKRVAKAIKETLPCKKVGMAVLGLEVAHAHIHLVPLATEGDMDFHKKISNPDSEKMQQIAAAISANFA